MELLAQYADDNDKDRANKVEEIESIDEIMKKNGISSITPTVNEFSMNVCY